MSQDPTNSEAGAARTATPDPTDQIPVADYYRPDRPHESPPYATPLPGGRAAVWGVVAALFIAILLVATGVLAYLAAHNHSVADKYRRLDQAEIAMVSRLNSQMTIANRNVATLDAQVRTLNDQLSRTQGHLADVANQKAKDVDLLKEAGQIASDLNVCIDQAGKVGQDFASSLETGQPSGQALQTEADRVATVCDRAQIDNQQLQATISGTA